MRNLIDDQKIRLVFPHDHIHTPDSQVKILEGFCLRFFQDADRDLIIDLMKKLGWTQWDNNYLDYWQMRALHEGWIIVEDPDTNQIAGCCIAAMPPSGERGGELAWLAVHPDNQRQGLGKLLATRVTERLIKAHARPIFLTTELFRIDAIRLYKNLGYVPDLTHENTATHSHLFYDPV